VTATIAVIKPTIRSVRRAVEVQISDIPTVEAGYVDVIFVCHLEQVDAVSNPVAITTVVTSDTAWSHPENRTERETNRQIGDWVLKNWQDIRRSIDAALGLQIGGAS
jgi:Pyruvate/2-oxoacid:ferredoxin oxidoreductase gamma subunit